MPRSSSEIVERLCACGCGATLSARYPGGKPSYARYILGHQQRGRALTPRQREVLTRSREQRFMERYPNGKKTCQRCEVEFDLEVFFYSNKWREICPDCTREVNRERAKASYRRNPIEARKVMLCRRYGITMGELDELLAVKVCEICGSEIDLHIDHDHRTGVVRGRPCGNCNRGLGLFRDDPALLRAAAEYLERHS